VNAAVRIGAYAGALVMVLGASFYLAPIVRNYKPFPSGHTHSSATPSAVAPSVHRESAGTDVDTDPDSDRDAGMGAATVPTAAATPTAMSSAAAGYRLVSDTTSFPVGVSQPFRFQLLGPDGRPLRASPQDADDLHVSLVVVRRDGAGFGHFEPVQDMTGTWTTPLSLPGGGSYAAWVSFTPRSGQELVLGADLTVAGQFSPQTPPSPAPAADIDGYHVDLAGTPIAGRDSELTLTVSQNGQAVTDLQIDDGTFAHLVMIRAGDLAFADAHPQPVTGRAGALRFTVHPSAAGTCWIYVVFRHHDQTHTAAITMAVSDPATTPNATPTPTPAPAPTPAPRPADGRR
jgi:hypothetical protein